jgi:hypothetical protein
VPPRETEARIPALSLTRESDSAEASTVELLDLVLVDREGEKLVVTRTSTPKASVARAPVDAVSDDRRSGDDRGSGNIRPENLSRSCV